MTVSSSRFSVLPDFGNTVTMRRVEDGAEVSSGITGENAVPLNRLRARWRESQTEADTYTIKFTVTQIDGTAATYSLIVTASNTSGSARTEVARIPSITAPGVYSLTIDSDQLATTANWLSCAVEISAASPRSITYGAELTTIRSHA
ncbi:MAG: hypothetical protein ABL907_08560 [Hyphomicrobium sp.]